MRADVICTDVPGKIAEKYSPGTAEEFEQAVEAEAIADGFYDDLVVSDGAGGTVAAGSLDDPGVGTWDPSDDEPDHTIEAGEDEARAAHGA